MTKIIYLIILLSISCANKEDANYHNLKLNFKEDTTQRYLSTTYFYINSIQLIGTSKYLQSIIDLYTNKKKISSIDIELENKNTKSIKAVSKKGIAKIHSVTDSLSVTKLLVNDDNTKIKLPYILSINSKSEMELSPKNKIIQNKNNSTHIMNIAKIINKHKVLPSKMLIKKPWTYRITDKYVSKRKNYNVRSIFNILYTRTLNKIQYNKLYLASSFTGNVSAKITLNYAVLNLEIKLNGISKSVIDNNVGLEEQSLVKTDFHIRGLLMPSPDYKAKLQTPKLEIDGQIIYRNIKQNT